MPDIGIIILAAGQSQRMGKPKQLLNIGENSLIQHVVKIAESTSYTPIVVVLGSHFEWIKKEIKEFEVTPVLNENWKKGMGTSVSRGIIEMQKLNSNLKAVFILLVDQPLISLNLLNNFEKLYLQTGKKIIAAKYDKTFGVPALFDKTTFEELKSLSGEKGAKKIIQKFIEKEEVVYVDFPKGQLDLDTKADYDRFIKDFDGK